ncbi:hypothetical protein LSAT2_013810 [Lamellibrachia satsuma]|nr:hypothetical protein LSAT2_013810 [Lamellibrachia satsuma]
MCYVPVQTNFVCACLKDMHSSSHSEDTPAATMTQLYVFAAVNIAKKLHPSLKGNKTDIDEKKFCEVVGDSLKNHAKLAKYCTMSTPLRIIMYEEDLDRFHISDKDKNTGFLAQSLKGNQSPCLKRRCWIFHHLTIQEMFCALGLLRGPRKALLKLINDETSVGQREVLIMFVVGLLCDPRNARFMELLETAKDQLDPRPRTFKEKVVGRFKTLKLTTSKHHLNPRTFIKKLAHVFQHLQLITAIHESQCPELTDLVPREIKSNKVFPTEMMALSWALRQRMCRITSLDLSGSQLDIHLVRQLCAGLTDNTALKSLKLHYCLIPAEGMRALAAGLETLTALRYLDLGYNDVSVAAAKRLARSLERLKRLEGLELRRCHITDSGAQQIVAATVNSPSLWIFKLSDNHISPHVERQLKEETRRRKGPNVELDHQQSPPAAESWKDCDRLGCVPWT